MRAVNLFRNHCGGLLCSGQGLSSTNRLSIVHLSFLRIIHSKAETMPSWSSLLRPVQRLLYVCVSGNDHLTCCLKMSPLRTIPFWLAACVSSLYVPGYDLIPPRLWLQCRGVRREIFVPHPLLLLQCRPMDGDDDNEGGRNCTALCLPISLDNYN